MHIEIDSSWKFRLLLGGLLLAIYFLWEYVASQPHHLVIK